jgi:LysR family transcriptional activator of nhaA
VNYNHLYYFHTVACLGSQAAAARELGLRQSTVSEQVRQVEKLLGRKLFERTNTGLRLTDAGRTCLSFTETMFGAANKLMEAFERQKTPRTVGAVGVTSSVSRSFAAAFLLPLFDDDTLMPRIRHGTSAELMQKLSRGEVDVVLSDNRPAMPMAERLQTELAMNLKLLLVGQHTDYAAKRGLRFVHFTSGSPWRLEVDRCLDAIGCNTDVIGESDDLGVLRMAALKGRGAVALPRRVVAADLADMRLQVLSELDCELPVHLSYASESLDEAVKNTVARLLSAVRGESVLGLEGA